MPDPMDVVDDAPPISPKLESILRRLLWLGAPKAPGYD